MKRYNKPTIIAKNAPAGSYAAGCPANVSHSSGGVIYCWKCECAK